MQDEIAKVCAEILKEITPSKGERVGINAVTKKLEASVVSACKKLGVKAVVRIEGSVAKDTWICGEPDVDVFMRVSTKIPHESLGKACLKVAREATKGSKQVERFAEHPYLEAFVRGVRVNIVPCYDVKRGDWHSATDRTPYHTDYMQKHLNTQLRGEVRLLKKFMKGIGVYGAEIRVGGFSGYLCELLVLHYGGFVDTLKAFAPHKQRIVVDIEGHYKDREHDIELLFKEPLVIVDPVDRGRNVASAVQARELHSFVAAARAFLNKPDKRFFYPPETVAMSQTVFKDKLAKRGSTIITVAFDKVDAVPDILWGQLYKSQRSLHKLVELNDFHILRDLAWSDEKSVCMFIFELENCCIPPVKKHLGPPLDKQQECENFLAKHTSKPATVAGPYVEDGRWVVQVRRKHTDACVLLRERLRDGGKSAGVAEAIAKKLQKGFKVLVNEEITRAYAKNREFATFLTEFLSGMPKWLETVET
jgi:tRNA nucleotidyltransferase (CCA-adding enzyme)